MSQQLTKDEIKRHIKLTSDIVAEEILNDYDNLIQKHRHTGNIAIDETYYFYNKSWTTFFTVHQKNEIPVKYSFTKIIEKPIIHLLFTQFLANELSKDDIEKYINRTNDTVAKELYSLLDELTQEVEYIGGAGVYKKFYFKDKRAATLFLVEESGEELYSFSKHFDAPTINVEDFKSLLPLSPNNYCIQTNFDYKISHSIFYGDEKQAFRIPIIDVLNNLLNRTSKDIYYIHPSNIESMSIKLNSHGNECVIEFDIDKYAGINLQYHSISLKYIITLNNFEITHKEEAHNTYNSK